MLAARAESDRQAIVGRRSKDAERSSRRRHAMSRDVTLDNVIARDVTDETPFPSPSPFLPPDPQQTPTPALTPGIENTRASKANPFPKPNGVAAEHWRDFLANRKRKALSNTPTAHKRLMDDLTRLSDDEWPPGRLIEHAAAHGWAGIYDPRVQDRQIGTRKQSVQQAANGLRGARPEPAVDMWRKAEADLAAERASGHQEADIGTGAALPAYLSNRH